MRPACSLAWQTCWRIQALWGANPPEPLAEPSDLNGPKSAEIRRRSVSQKPVALDECSTVLARLLEVPRSSTPASPTRFRAIDDCPSVGYTFLTDVVVFDPKGSSC